MADGTPTAAPTSNGTGTAVTQPAPPTNGAAEKKANGAPPPTQAETPAVDPLQAIADEFFDLEAHGSKKIRQKLRNGEEREITVAEAFREGELKRESYRRMKDAEELKKKALEGIDYTKSLVAQLRDPQHAIRTLQDMGANPAEIAAIFQKFADEERRMTPEQKARRDLEWERADIDAERQKLAQEKEMTAKERYEASVQAQQAHYQQKAEQAFTKAIMDLGVNPETERQLFSDMLRDMATQARELLDINAPWDPAELARDAHEALTQRTTVAIPPDVDRLEKLMGKDRFNALLESARKRLLREMKVQEEASKTAAPQRAPFKPKEEPRRYRTPEEVLEELRGSR